MWKCNRCEKDHSGHRFEFVHVVNRLGHHLRDEPNMTIAEFYDRFGEDAVSVHVAPVGRLPAPLQFAAALSADETLVGVIPSDEYLHEEMYPIELEPGLWMTSDGQKHRAGEVALMHEETVDTPISHLMRQRSQDVRGVPPKVLEALVPSGVSARVRSDLAKAAKGDRIAPPFPYSADEGASWTFSDGSVLTVSELLWEAESNARARRRESVLEKALRNRAAKG